MTEDERNAPGPQRLRLRRLRRTADRRARAIAQGVPFALGSEAEPPIPSTCAMCHTPFDTAPRIKQPTLDRVVPARGYVPDNVQWLHRGCNSLKAECTLADARERAATDPRFVVVVAYLARHVLPPVGNPPNSSDVL